MLFFTKNPPELVQLRQAIVDSYQADETECVNNLINTLQFSESTQQAAAELAKKLVEAVRTRQAEKSGIEAFMLHYDLSTEEGIMLMCLAEALLRIPDKETESLLIRDKLTSANWKKHLGLSSSAFVNISTWGLALTGKILKPEKADLYFKKLWDDLLRRTSEPVIRQVVREAMKILSEQFVLGRTIEEALIRSQDNIKKGYCFSYDMLGEAAHTQVDADAYYSAYQNAIAKIGEANVSEDLLHVSSISVKLSALYPRYEFNHYEEALPYLIARVKSLALQAKKAGVSLTIDAEEADRLDLSLDIIAAIFNDADFKDWEGLGLAVQAYQKRAYHLISWLVDLARQNKRRIQVRLVKGAYWDSEIKMAQVASHKNYPVFTRKSSTDISYLACAKKMLAAQDAIYPQFATHNAYTVAAILIMMEGQQKYDFEFQSLQGMGRALDEMLIDKQHFGVPCRIYAPVGSHEDLLPYLVRRLLENGANSSFVNQIADINTPIEKLVEDPVSQTLKYETITNSKIPLPKDIYGEERVNSQGIDFSDFNELKKLSESMQKYVSQQWQAAPFNQKISDTASAQEIVSPTNHRDVVGFMVEATNADVDLAIQKASDAFAAWNARGHLARAEILIKASDLLEKNHAELMSLAIREAGKTLPNALSEVREATDFCRYYAHIARTQLLPQPLPGPTGEDNQLYMQGRGPMICISPWNFPIAIFTGQVATALVAGNPVIAKPAEQTPLVAARIVQLFIEAGVPEEVLQLMPGRGETVGKALIDDARVCGVLFTGSTETAKLIQRTLAQKEGPIVPLIAETGGINAMLVDSTALPEQLITDVIFSAFDSAGQRCSALRVLFIQDDIADEVIAMLRGAMAEINVGDPMLLKTDVGPVIDKDAYAMLQAHAEKMYHDANLIYRVELPENTKQGTFIAPQAFELPELALLSKEVFGPILHVIRYQRENLDKVIDDINALGYGLTFGIQSRIDETVDYIQQRINAGNIYVNRNMIGAVVGVQPFGGSWLSGSGPKAGGPHYLARLSIEKTLTINTTAAGGNATLMAMSD